MSALTADQVARKLWAASWGSKGSAPTDQDKLYWNADFWNSLDKHGTDEMNPPVPDYAYKRAIGWQSSGADVPPYGPFANPPSPLHAVPSYPGDAQQPPTPTPATPPTDQNPPFIEPTQVLALLQAMNGKLDTLLARATSVTTTTTPDALMSKALVQVLAQVKALRKLVTPTKKAAKP